MTNNALGRISVFAATAVALNVSADRANGQASEATTAASSIVLNSKSIFSPGLSGVVRSVATTFLLQGSKTDQSASAQTSFLVGRSSLVLALEANSSVNNPNTVLADITGLSTGTVGTIGISGVRWWGERPLPGAPGVLMRNWCVTKKSQPDSPIARDYNCNDASRATLPRELWPEIDQLFAFLGQPLLWAAEIKGGPAEYDFVGPGATLDTINRWQGAGRFGAGMFLERFFGVFLSAGAAYKVKYKEGDPADLCVPITGSTALKCTKSAFGSPTQKRGWAWAIDARKIVKGTYGINLRGGRDATAGFYTIQMPLYAIPNEKQALVGGILPSWSSKTHKVGVAVFIGSTFGLTIAKP